MLFTPKNYSYFIAQICNNCSTEMRAALSRYHLYLVTEGTLIKYFCRM